MEEGPDRVYGPNVVLVFPPLNEGNESGCVQMQSVMVGRRVCMFRAYKSSIDHTSGLEPLLLQAG